MVPKTQTIFSTDKREEREKGVRVGYPPSTYEKLPEETLKEIGSDEAKKESEQSFNLNKSKFDTLVEKNSSKILYKLKSAKILDFFPDEIVIETNKISISLRDFFIFRRLLTVVVDDIEDVFVDTTPFYATLKIVDKGFVENVINVQFLKKDEAKKARRIIQGLMTAKKEGIDLASLPEEGLIEKLETLGDAGVVEHVHR